MQVVHSEFSEISKWDINGIRCERYRRAHPTFLPLRDCIEEGGPIERPFNSPNAIWPVYGVDNRIGVSLSYAMAGEEFNQPYKRILPGDFVHNPTRANVGSFGRVGNVESDALTSPDYQVWRVTQGYLPEFLEILIKSKAFLSLVEIHRVGAVKRRLFFANLCEMVLPRPGIDVQRQMVDAYNRALTATKVLGDERDEIATAFDRFLAERLCFDPSKFTGTEFGRDVDFSGLDRWDLPFFRMGYLALQHWLAGFRAAARLGDLATFRFEGWAASDFPGGEFRYLEIGGVHRVDGITELTTIGVDEAPSRAQYRCYKGDMLISMTRPYMGKIAMVENIGDGSVCSSGFSVIAETRKDVVKEYLFFILRSIIGTRQLEQRMSGGSYPAITQTQLEKIVVPIPSETIQKEIAIEGWKAMHRAREISAKQSSIAVQAMKPFEALFAAGHGKIAVGKESQESL